MEIRQPCPHYDVNGQVTELEPFQQVSYKESSYIDILPLKKTNRNYKKCLKNTSANSIVSTTTIHETNFMNSENSSICQINQFDENNKLEEVRDCVKKESPSNYKNNRIGQNSSKEYDMVKDNYFLLPSIEDENYCEKTNNTENETKL